MINILIYLWSCLVSFLGIFCVLFLIDPTTDKSLLNQYPPAALLGLSGVIGAFLCLLIAIVEKLNNIHEQLKVISHQGERKDVK